MALNPPLDQDGTPFRIQNEYGLIKRKSMDIEVKVKGMSKLSGSGRVVLTTSRLIFIHKNYQTAKFKSFDMPVGEMKKFAFK